MKLSDWAMVVIIVSMLCFIVVKNNERKANTFNNVVESVQNLIDK